MILFGWLAMLFAGLATLRACGRRDVLSPFGVGLALLVGATWLALLAALLSPAGLVSAGALLAGLGLIGASGASVAKRRDFRATLAAVEAKSQPPADSPAVGVEAPRGWATFAPALLVLALTVVQAFGRPVYNVDAQRRWVLRAQWTAAEGTLTPTALADEAFAASHPSYPPLVSSVAAFGLLLGADRDAGVRPGFPVFFFALCALVHGFVRRRAGPRATAIVTTALALTPALGLTDQLGLGAAAAHADVALAAFLTAATALVLERGPGSKRGAWVLLALVTLGAAWTKNEGMAFVLAMGAAALVIGTGAPDGRRRGAVVLGAGLVGIVVWKALARHMPVMEGEDYVSGGILAVLAENTERVPTILARFGAEFVTWQLWGLAWLSVPVVLALGLARRAPRAFWLTTVWLGLGLGMVLLAYVATGWKGDNYTTLMDVSLARLLAHHVPLVFLLWGFVLAPAAPSAAEGR